MGKTKNKQGVTIMKLMTKEIQKKLPKLNSQESKCEKDLMVQVKFFCPWNQWTWYGIEYDGKDIFFGYVIGFENELGYFSLEELKSVKQFGLGIERDLYFAPKRLSEIKEGI